MTKKFEDDFIEAFRKMEAAAKLLSEAKDLTLDCGVTLKDVDTTLWFDIVYTLGAVERSDSWSNSGCSYG